MGDRPVRLVCFDWGGVLLRICRGWAEGCAAAGVPLREGATGPRLVARRRELSLRYQTGEIGCEAFFAGIAEATDGLYTPEEVARVHDAWLLHEYDGVDTLMDELNGTEHIETALLSNTNHRHWMRNQPGPDGSAPDFPVAAQVRHPHASHLLGLAKPDGAIYRALERETGYSGDEILFFDDLEENVHAARETGWRSERIDHAGDTATQIRTHLARHGVL